MKCKLNAVLVLFATYVLSADTTLAKSCLRSESERLKISVISYWVERCYEREQVIMFNTELKDYRKKLADNDCQGARAIYEQAFRRRHPELPLEFLYPLDSSKDWMWWIIERNTHDLYFCFVAEKLRCSEAEIARLEIDAPPFPGFIEAIEAGQKGEVPPAVDDRNHAIIDLWFLAKADHADAQALLLEVAYVRWLVGLKPGYGLFLIERLKRKAYPLSKTEVMRRIATEGLSGEIVAELSALAAQPDADYVGWYLRRRKAGTLPR